MSAEAHFDMTVQAFRAEAARNEFKPEMGGMFLRDTSTPSGGLYACVTEGGVLHYRASLEHAILLRAEARALGQRVIKLAAEGKTEIEIVAITGKPRPQVVGSRQMEEERARLARSTP